MIILRKTKNINIKIIFKINLKCVISLIQLLKTTIKRMSYLQKYRIYKSDMDYHIKGKTILIWDKHIWNRKNKTNLIIMHTTCR